MSMRPPQQSQPNEPGWWPASDGLWYPPEARPGAAPAPPPPRGYYQQPAPFQQAPTVIIQKRRRKWPWVLLALVVIIGIAAAAGGGSDDSNPKKDSGLAKKSSADEVKITTCKGDETLGIITLEGTATNTSSKRSDYLIQLVVEDPAGTQVESSTAFAENVEPGKSAVWKAPTFEKWVAGLKCRVVKVDRNASL